MKVLIIGFRPAALKKAAVQEDAKTIYVKDVP
jgi:hypothetical protein